MSKQDLNNVAIYTTLKDYRRWLYNQKNKAKSPVIDIILKHEDYRITANDKINFKFFEDVNNVKVCVGINIEIDKPNEEFRTFIPLSQIERVEYNNFGMNTKGDNKKED